MTIPVLTYVHGHTARAKKLVIKNCDTAQIEDKHRRDLPRAHLEAQRVGVYSEVHCSLLPRPTLASRPGTLRRDTDTMHARTTATHTCKTRYLKPLGWLTRPTRHEKLYMRSSRGTNLPPNTTIRQKRRTRRADHFYAILARVQQNCWMHWDLPLSSAVNAPFR